MFYSSYEYWKHHKYVHTLKTAPPNHCHWNSFSTDKISASRVSVSPMSMKHHSLCWKLAKMLLTIPATSVPSESLFNCWRCCISTKSLSDWGECGYFDYFLKKKKKNMKLWKLWRVVWQSCASVSQNDLIQFIYAIYSHLSASFRTLSLWLKKIYSFAVRCI